MVLHESENKLRLYFGGKVSCTQTNEDSKYLPWGVTKCGRRSGTCGALAAHSLLLKMGSSDPHPQQHVSLAGIADPLAPAPSRRIRPASS